MESSQIGIQKIRQSFDQACDYIFKNLQGAEQASCNLSGEDNLYVRFNHGLVRQNTTVLQANFSLQLQTTTQVTKLTFSLSGDTATDLQKVKIELHRLRKDLEILPASPTVSPLQNEGSSNTEFLTHENPMDHVQSILKYSEGLEVVGLYCGGLQFQAQRNSLGQNHWYCTESFFFDYSIYQGFKAVKELYSDRNWNDEKFSDQMRRARLQIEKLKLPVQSIPPGQHDVYLAPAAVNEIFSLLNWGSFSQKAFQTGPHALKLLSSGQKKFSQTVNIRENFELGWAPPFNELGQKSEAQVSLIEQGQLVQLLTHPRTAQEFKLKPNAALESESTRSLEMDPGNISESGILRFLGTGLYLSNLHYLNWSDLQHGRLTGMTRFACFYVKDGELVGPVQDLRFDVSIYDLLGAQLKGSTSFTERHPGVSTYFEREYGGRKLPGLFVKNCPFTL